MIKSYFISKKDFTEEELSQFIVNYGYKIEEIFYSSEIEIDFSNKDEKDFLLKNGVPKILARFGV